METVARPLISAGDGTSEASWMHWLANADLPSVEMDDLVAPSGRAVIVAPHPDDEVLLAGGLLARLAHLKRSVRVVVVTDGEGSHPGSVIWPPERLAVERPQETETALRVLGVTETPIRLSMPDGQLRAKQALLTQRLQELLKPTDIVFTTWRCDGHPDHEATGEAAVAATRSRGARLVEIPVWAWHWNVPGRNEMPWERAKVLRLRAEEVDRKQRALGSYTSQSTVDASTGSLAVLRPTLIQRAARPFEVIFT